MSDTTCAFCNGQTANGCWFCNPVLHKQFLSPPTAFKFRKEGEEMGDPFYEDLELLERIAEALERIADCMEEEDD